MGYNYRIRFNPTSASFPWIVDLWLDDQLVAERVVTTTTKWGARHVGRKIVRHTRKYGTHRVSTVGK